MAHEAQARGLNWRLLTPSDHPEDITMPHAKFRADLLKTMGV